MRFRAKLVDPNSITDFTNVTSALGKNVKTGALRLSPDKVCFVISEKGPLATNLWCELPQSDLFSDYRIEGKGRDNEIYLLLNIEQLSQALKLSHNAETIKLKLTKREGAFITLEVTQPSSSGIMREIVHNIPVNVIPQRLWSEYREPDMPDIDVSLFLPPLKQFKGLLDKMKLLSNFATISANMVGELQLRLETDVVSVATYYQKLHNHYFDPSIPVTNHMYNVRIDLRKLCQVLSGQFIPSKIICNIVDDKGIQLFLIQDNMSIQYYIPSVSA